MKNYYLKGGRLMVTRFEISIEENLKPSKASELLAEFEEILGLSGFSLDDSSVEVDEDED
jgi:hypothetical protein